MKCFGIRIQSLLFVIGFVLSNSCSFVVAMDDVDDDNSAGDSTNGSFNGGMDDMSDTDPSGDDGQNASDDFNGNQDGQGRGRNNNNNIQQRNKLRNQVRSMVDDILQLDGNIDLQQSRRGDESYGEKKDSQDKYLDNLSDTGEGEAAEERKSINQRIDNAIKDLNSLKEDVNKHYGHRKKSKVDDGKNQTSKSNDDDNDKTEDVTSHKKTETKKSLKRKSNAHKNSKSAKHKNYGRFFKDKKHQKIIFTVKDIDTSGIMTNSYINRPLHDISSYNSKISSKHHDKIEYKLKLHDKTSSKIEEEPILSDKKFTTKSYFSNKGGCQSNKCGQ